jgi:hypothetical protein
MERPDFGQCLDIRKLYINSFYYQVAALKVYLN